MMMRMRTGTKVYRRPQAAIGRTPTYSGKNLTGCHRCLDEDDDDADDDDDGGGGDDDDDKYDDDDDDDDDLEQLIMMGEKVKKKL